MADIEEDLDGDGTVDVADCQGAPFGVSCRLDEIMVWDVDAWVCAPAPFVSSPSEAVWFDDFFGAMDTRVWSTSVSGGSVSFGSNYLGLVYFEASAADASASLGNSIPSGANLFGTGGRPSLEYKFQHVSRGANHRVEVGLTSGSTLVGGVRWTGSAWEAVCREWGSASDPEHTAPITQVSFNTLRLELDGPATAIVVLFDGVEVATLSDCGPQFVPNGSRVTVQAVESGYGFWVLDYVAWRKSR